MKNLKSIFAFIMLVTLPALLFSQEAKKKTEVIYIQTSAMCDECKDKIESSVRDLKGIKKADLNLADKKIMVEYSPKKVSPEKIKNAIAMTGYDADEVKADPSAYQQLPSCCKKEAEKH